MRTDIKGIVFASNTGHTKEYAELLGMRTGLPVFDLEGEVVLPNGSNIIYLGWLMAGKVQGYKKSAKKYHAATVIGVGMAPNGSQIEDIRKSNGLGPDVPVFCLQGGFEMDKLTGLYKLMMYTMRKAVGKKLENKTDRTPEEDQTLDLMLNGANLVSEESLADVYAWLEG